MSGGALTTFPCKFRSEKKFSFALQGEGVGQALNRRQWSRLCVETVCCQAAAAAGADDDGASVVISAAGTSTRIRNTTIAMSHQTGPHRAHRRTHARRPSSSIDWTTVPNTWFTQRQVLTLAIREVVIVLALSHPSIIRGLHRMTRTRKGQK